MNASLIKKLLKKIDLKDLYDEVKDSDTAMCNLGVLLIETRPEVFAGMVRVFANEVIKSCDTALTDLLKAMIVELDGTEVFSVNKIAKKKVPNKPVVDSCGSGRIASC